MSGERVPAPCPVARRLGVRISSFETEQIRFLFEGQINVLITRHKNRHTNQSQPRIPQGAHTDCRRQTAAGEPPGGWGGSTWHILGPVTTTAPGFPEDARGDAGETRGATCERRPGAIRAAWWPEGVKAGARGATPLVLNVTGQGPMGREGWGRVPVTDRGPDFQVGDLDTPLLGSSWDSGWGAIT